MNIKNFGIGCGVIVIALLVFLVYRLANPWEPMHFNGYEVQRNRFTERVRLRVEDTWVESLDNNPSADAIPENELKRAKLSDLAFGPHGYLCGKITVAGDKPLQGRLALLITVKQKANGKRRIIESERAMRCNVDWSPGVHPFVLNTGMTPPSSAEKFAVTVTQVNAIDR